MSTVFTPEALARSNYRKIEFKDMINNSFEEAFLFDFPSPSLLDQENGDGRLTEIIDVNSDMSGVHLEDGKERKIPLEHPIYIR